MSPQKLTYRLMCGTWVVAGIGLACGGTARAVGPGLALDAVTLTHMEEQAAQANPREQCYRYTELLAALTEVEGQEIAAGQEEQARVTMQKMNEVAAKVQVAAAGDAKKLKDAEKMLEFATHRVSDMVHVVGYEQQQALQATWQHMNQVHSSVLAMVFSH
jgi:hypothetical protein